VGPDLNRSLTSKVAHVLVARISRIGRDVSILYTLPALWAFGAGRRRSTGWLGQNEFNTPRSENNTNFSSNAQEKAATRGGPSGALQFLSEFSLLYSQRIQPTL
jgi:hypothetical protein